MRKSLLLLPLFVILTSCRSLLVQSSSYTYAPPTYSQPQIYDAGKIPDGLILIGIVSTGDNKLMTPTEKCTYTSCMDAIIEECKKMGGKYIEVVMVTEPGNGSTCYSVSAKIYTDKQ